MDSNDIVKYVYPQDISELEGNLSSDELSVLEQINQKVAAAPSLEEVMDFLFEETRDIFTCDRLAVAFLEEKGSRLISRWIRADYEPLLLNVGAWQDLHGTTLQEVLNRRCVRTIADLEKYVEHNPESKTSGTLIQEGVRSSMTCPIIVEDRPVGMLFRSSKQVNAYDNHQVLLHYKIAERLSQAVEKTHRIDQLIAANQAYMEMLGFASHELKSPLATIIMQASMLIDGYAGEIQPAQRDGLESIVRKSRGLITLAKEYLDLARYESGNLKFTPERAIDLKLYVVKRILEDLEPQINDKNSKVEVNFSEEPFLLDCDSALMKIVFNNLIGNAIKYGQEDGTIKVSVESKDNKVKVSVWNSGTGFPDSEKNNLFKRFSRLQIPEFHSVKGTGVGLYITWQIIQLHQGKIWADSEYGKWAQFSFEIPHPLEITSP